MTNYTLTKKILFKSAVSSAELRTLIKDIKNIKDPEPEPTKRIARKPTPQQEKALAALAEKRVRMASAMTSEEDKKRAREEARELRRLKSDKRAQFHAKIAEKKKLFLTSNKTKARK